MTLKVTAAFDPHRPLPARPSRIPTAAGRRRSAAAWRCRRSRVRSRGVCGGGKRRIGRGPDDRHAHVGADAHGNHVLFDLLAEPHAGVEALAPRCRRRRCGRRSRWRFRVRRGQPGDGRIEPLFAACSLALMRTARPASRATADSASASATLSRCGPIAASALRRLGQHDAAGRAPQQAQAEAAGPGRDRFARRRHRRRLRCGAGEALRAAMARKALRSLK